MTTSKSPAGGGDPVLDPARAPQRRPAAGPNHRPTCGRQRRDRGARPSSSAPCRSGRATIRGCSASFGARRTRSGQSRTAPRSHRARFAARPGLGQIVTILDEPRQGPARSRSWRSRRTFRECSGVLCQVAMGTIQYDFRDAQRARSGRTDRGRRSRRGVDQGVAPVDPAPGVWWRKSTFDLARARHTKRLRPWRWLTEPVATFRIWLATGRLSPAKPARWNRRAEAAAAPDPLLSALDPHQ